MESKLIAWTTHEDKPAVSVVFGRSFVIGADGRPQDAGPFTLQEDYVFYEGIDHGDAYTRPSLLARDVDLWPWRGATDLVVQGVARPPEPRSSLKVTLTCRGSGANFVHTLAVHGDRVVERGRHGLQVSAPERFEEMPLRYDKAYGGTDELSRERYADPEEMKMIYDLVGEAEDREWSEYSYPRNPVGKGYVLDPELAVGTRWPNIEFPDDPLKLEELVLPREDWGRRPYPAGFDWFGHAWFPRVAFFGEIPETSDGRVPKTEVDMGLLPADLTDTPILLRPKHHFAQGAHPRLWRNRLSGDERITITTIGTGGAPLDVQLPGLSPVVRLQLLDGKTRKLDSKLDLVLVQGESRRLTLLWHALAPIAEPFVPPDFRERMPYSIAWS
jgi:hypothetical protein